MESFQFMKKYFRICGLFKTEDRLDSINLQGIAHNLIVLAIMMTIIVPPIAFIILEPRDAGNISGFLYNMGASLSVVGSYCAMAYIKSQINRTIYQLDDKINARVAIHSESSKLYKDTNECVERICKLLLVTIFLGGSSVFIMPLLNPAIDYVRGNYSRDSWYLPFQAQMPYDTSSANIFAITFILQYCVCVTGTIHYAMTVALFIGFCRFATTHVIDIVSTIDDINDTLTAKTIKLDRNQRNEIMRIFLNAIKHHSDAITYHKNFSDAMSGVVFAFILSSGISTIGLMYQLEMSSELSYVEMFNTMTLAANMFGPIFVFCYLGDSVAGHFESIGLSLCRNKWYLFPAEIKQKIVPILIVSQRPRHITGLGLMICTLSDFTTIVKTILSYFMALRTFA